jgi:MYXO-CTERM domain-containing protein
MRTSTTVSLALVAFLTVASAAHAAPKVFSSATAPPWDAGAALELKDDGIAPDVTAGDHVFTASMEIGTAGVVEYKVSRNGTDLDDGGLGTVSNGNLRFTLVGAGPFTVTFRYDTRDLTAQAWLPATESASDSVTETLDADGSARTWVAVGDFQSAVGDTDWNTTSTTTVARDDGMNGDAVAGDGIYTYHFVAGTNLTGKSFKFTPQGGAWGTKLGTNGWSYDGEPQDSANGTFSAQAGQGVFLEMDARRGRVRVRVLATSAKLLLSEVVVSPTEHEYIEIYNPNAFDVDLTNHFLSDWEQYYQVVTSPPPAVGSTDFMVRFPAGAVIPAGRYQTVSIAGAECLKTGCGVSSGLGQYPTYEIFRDESRSSTAIPDMVVPFPAALGSTRSLTDTGEPVTLFYWDGASDLVKDVDYVYFGAVGGNAAVRKTTATCVDGPDADTDTTCYLDDEATVNARVAPLASSETCRVDFSEGTQATPGNGITNLDETTETSQTTWRGCGVLSPNGPSTNFVDVTPAVANLVVGETAPITFKVFGDLARQQELTGKTPTWTTTPATPTSFSLAGNVVTAVKGGSAEKVNVTVDGVTGSTTVNVSYKAIVVTCEPAVIGTGGTSTCQAVAHDVNDQPVPGVTFTWDVLSGTSATVSPLGVVTGSATEQGVTRVRARGEGDAVTQGTFDVTVAQRELTTIVLSVVTPCPSVDCLVVTGGSEYTVAAGASLALQARGYDQLGAEFLLTTPVWVSSSHVAAEDPVADTLVAKDVDGESTAVTVAEGTVASNAVVFNVARRVTSTVEVGGVPLNGNLEQGASVALTAVVKDQFGQVVVNEEVDWTSSDEGKVVVGADGTATASLELGSATIRATARSTPRFGEAVLNVVAATPVPTTVAVSPESATVSVGGDQTFTATVRDQFGSVMDGAVVTWTSSRPDVASITGGGVAHGFLGGTVTVTATSGDATGTATLVVRNPSVFSAAFTPAWSVESALELKDDGTGADLVAGDRVYAASTTFNAAGAVEYKVSRNGLDLSDGGVGTSTGGNMRFTLVGAGPFPVTFRYDLRPAGGAGWLPALESVSDSVTESRKPDGTDQVWVAVGPWQAAVGDVPWNNASSITVARDDGEGWDRVAGDGVHTYGFVATGALVDQEYKFTGQGGWEVKLGADGWNDGSGDSSNGTFSARAGQVVVLQLDARHGRMRARAFNNAKILLSEVVSGPGGRQFIEIFNPQPVAVDLTDHYLANTNAYWRLVEVAAPAVNEGAFVARFPADSVIEPHAYQTVALDGAVCFRDGCGSGFGGYGVTPTYEFYVDNTASAGAVPDMVEAYEASVSVTRTVGAGPVVVFQWDGLSDLVADADYVHLGEAGGTAVDKTGVSVDGLDLGAVPTAYLPETAPLAQRVAPAGASLCRVDFREPGQEGSTGNGVTGADETREDMTASWWTCPDVTPNATPVKVMAVTPSPTTVMVNSSAELRAFAFADGARAQVVLGKSFTWTKRAADPTHVSWDLRSLVVTGLSAGTGDVVEAATEGVSGSTTVTVRYRRVAVSCGKTLLAPGMTTSCTAAAYDGPDQQVAGVAFTWDVKTGSSVAVNAEGAVTTLAQVGVSEVRALGGGDDQTEGVLALEVQARALDSLAVTLVACPAQDCREVTEGSRYLVAAGSSLALAAVGTDQFGDAYVPAGLTWTSTNPDAATVDALGALAALATADGLSTQVTATEGAATSNTLVFDVEARAAATAELGNVPPGGVLDVGERFTLTVTVRDQFGAGMPGMAVTWSSSDDLVASVDESGEVVGLAEGEATVTATVDGTGVWASVDLEVGPSASVPTTVTVSPANALMVLAGTQTFTATVRDQFGGAMAGVPVAWSSSAQGVATVDADGVVTPHAAGSATITARVGTDLQDTASVVVTDKSIFASITTPPWSAQAAIPLRDDGVFPDDVAGDGVYVGRESVAAAGTVEYKVSRNGLDLADGGVGTVGQGNLRLTLSGAGPFNVTFRYDTRDRTADGWLPPAESVADSALGDKVWVAVGAFQSGLGDGSFNVDSTVTVAYDDGLNGDRAAGDHVLTFQFVAPVALTNSPYKFAVQGSDWTTKLGADGWSYNGDATDSANGTFTVTAGQLVTLEMDLWSGRIRSRVESRSKLLLSEVVMGPTAGEYVEIHNPTANAVSLARYYLADTADYYKAVNGAGSSQTADFLVRFPDDASIPPGGYQTVSIAGAECFKGGCGSTFAGYGVYPTYELYRDEAKSSASVRDMVAVKVGTSPTLTDNMEPVVLFTWDGVSDLVKDADYVFYGASPSQASAANMPVDKTGITVDGPDADVVASAYLADTGKAAQSYARTTSSETCRVMGAGEVGQVGVGGNGVTGADETSEDWSQSWRGCGLATPGGPSTQVVAVMPDPVTLVVGEAADVSANVYADLGRTVQLTGRAVTWSVEPATPLHVRFDPVTARVTALSAGVGDKVVATADRVRGEAPVLVRYKDLLVSCGRVVLPPGGTTTCQATATNVSDAAIPGVAFTWSAGNANVAVSPQTPTTGAASVTGVTVGVGQVVARTEDGSGTRQGTLPVTVEARALSSVAVELVSTCPSTDCAVVADGVEYTLAALASVTLAAAGTDQFGDSYVVTEATWSSSEEAVAAAPVAGVLTVADVATGFTDVTATAEGFTSDAVRFNVERRRVADVVVDGLPNGNVVAPDGAVQLGARVLDQFGADVAGQAYTWTVVGGATVDGTGLVTAGSDVGTFTVTVAVDGTEVSRQVTLTIGTPVSSSSSGPGSSSGQSSSAAPSSSVGASSSGPAPSSTTTTTSSGTLSSSASGVVTTSSSGTPSSSAEVSSSGTETSSSGELPPSSGVASSSGVEPSSSGVVLSSSGGVSSSGPVVSSSTSDDGGGGDNPVCGCRATGEGDAGATVALLLAGLVLARVRRRR